MINPNHGISQSGTINDCKYPLYSIVSMLITFYLFQLDMCFLWLDVIIIIIIIIAVIIFCYCYDSSINSNNNDSF